MRRRPAADLIRLGGGAGYSGDRIEPAVELAESADLDYLVFECLAERTIALAQQALASDPHGGYDPRLVARLTAVLPACRAHHTRIITNMGAANPLSAADRARAVARDMGLGRLTVAAITGDDVLDLVTDGECLLEETGRPVASLGNALVSANAYVGAAPIVDALAEGADVVIAGRAADPSLFVAALVDAFGWAPDDWDRLGQGTVIGHLLECAGQVTGGYFADPDTAPIEGLARLGFPLAEVSRDGTAVITKVPGSGGAVTTDTCKAQLLYELHDPSRYLTPDVVADFSRVRVAEEAPDRVRVTGGRGRPRPDRLKVSVGYRDGFIGEGQISYSGEGAVVRARLAADVVAERLRLTGVNVRELRVDLIGLDSLHGTASRVAGHAPWEVRLRVAGRTTTLAAAERIGEEVEALYTNGPAGGGGARRTAREVLAIGTTYVPRDRVRLAVDYGKVS